MSKLKFPMGTFLEIDDLDGGRQLVRVCADGVTCVDGEDPTLHTPIVLHGVLSPRPLGTLMEAIRNADRLVAWQQLSCWLHARGGALDALQLLRAVMAMPAGDVKVDELVCEQALREAGEALAKARARHELLRSYAAAAA